jgi:hypothetical protein
MPRRGMSLLLASEYALHFDQYWAQQESKLAQRWFRTGTHVHACFSFCGMLLVFSTPRLTLLFISGIL